ncbi:hypothetical protein K469DRAFT_792623 [Zopfia rhizophila CBS 207.26]|uniref:Uncharacterized protein n=1 Tax=Zopfia rhizophila CBS 207.26 TaxID=1314779 RepID=A0A6A6DTU1_9PEZI|nr:hypothetical protein K469DRAFT_792623 [Zopfia rhizophila CBS 207.26]
MEPSNCRASAYLKIAPLAEYPRTAILFFLSSSLPLAIHTKQQPLPPQPSPPYEPSLLLFKRHLSLAFRAHTRVYKSPSSLSSLFPTLTEGQSRYASLYLERCLSSSVVSDDDSEYTTDLTSVDEDIDEDDNVSDGQMTDEESLQEEQPRPAAYYPAHAEKV